MTSKTSFPLRVPSIWPGTEVDVVRIVSSKNLTFAKAKDGRVYVIGRRNDVTLSRGWGLSDADRSAFAKLSGFNVKEYLAFVRKEAEKRAAAEKRADIESLKRKAAAAGYKLVKVKAKQP